MSGSAYPTVDLYRRGQKRGPAKLGRGVRIVNEKLREQSSKKSRRKVIVYLIGPLCLLVADLIGYTAAEWNWPASLREMDLTLGVGTFGSLAAVVWSIVNLAKRQRDLIHLILLNLNIMALAITILIVVLDNLGFLR